MAFSGAVLTVRRVSGVRLLAGLLVLGLVASGLWVLSPEPARAQSDGVVEVDSDWALVPSGLGAGAEFRLLFLTTAAYQAAQTGIDSYNSRVQTQAASGHAAIQEHSSLFKAVGSTSAVDARDNIGMNPNNAAHPDVEVYWLGGPRVAANTAGFWSSSWENWSGSDCRNPSGTACANANSFPWTGSNADGIKHANPLGNSPNVRHGSLAVNGNTQNPISKNNRARTEQRAMFGISPVFRVSSGTITRLDAQPSYSQVFEGERKEIVFQAPGATVDFSVSKVGGLSAGDYRIYYPHDASTPLSGSSWEGAVSNGLVRFGLEAVDDGVSGESGEVLRVSLTTDMDARGTADIEISDGQRRLGLLFRVRHNGEWVETDRPVITLHEGGAEGWYQYKSTSDEERYSSAMHLRIQRGQGTAQRLDTIRPGPWDSDRFQFRDSPPHTPASSVVPYLSAREVRLDEWHTVKMLAGQDDDAFDHSFSLVHEISFWPEKVKIGTWTIFGETRNTYSYRPGRFSEHSTVAVRIVDDDKWEQELVYARHDPDANGGNGGPDGEWVLASDRGLRDALPTALAPGSEYTFYIRLAVDPATLPKDGTVSRNQDGVDVYPSTFLPDRIPVWVDIPGYNNDQGIPDVRLAITPRPGNSIAARANSGGLFLVDTSGTRDHPSVEADYDYKDNFSADKGGLFWDEPLKVTIIVSDDAPTGVTRRLSVHSDSGLLTRPGCGRGWSKSNCTGDRYGYYFWDGFDIDIAETEELEARKQRQMSPEEFNPRTPEEILEYVKQVNHGNEGEEVPFVPFADVAALSEAVMEGEAARFEVTLTPAPDKARAVTVNVARRGGSTPLGLEAHLGVRTVMVGPTGRAQFEMPTADNDDPADNGSLYVAVVSSPIYRVSGFGGAAETDVLSDDGPGGHDAVRVLSVTDTTAEIEWDPTPGAASYEVIWIEGTSTTTHTSFTTDTSIELAGLKPGTDNNVAVLDDWWNRVGSAKVDTLEAGGGQKIYPVLSIAAGADISEGGTASFTITADPAPAAPLEAPVWVSQNGDYAAVGERGRRTVTIPTTGSASFTVATADDTADEDDGDIVAALEGGQTDYTVGPDRRASVSVADDDDGSASPEISIAAGEPVAEGDPAQFTITASPAPAQPLQVSVTVSQVGDYTTAVGAQTVTIGTGGTATLTVATDDDEADEPHGSVSADVASGDGYTVSATHSRATVTVADDDDPTPQVVITAGGGGVTEGANAVFSIAAVPAPSEPLTVNVTVSQDGDWGATEGSRTVTVPTSGTATVTVSTSDDDADETDGSVSVTVDSGDGYTVSTTQNSATVAVSDDDDPPPATPEISVTAGSGVTEGGDASFTVTADPAPAAPLQVSVSVSQSGDFGATTGTQTVTVGTGGTATVTVSVSTSDDDADEPDGSVSVTVDSGDGYTVSTTQNSATVAVSDDDDPPPATPVVSVTAGSGVTEGGDASFTVTADPAPTAPLQVSVSVSQSGDWGATTGTRSVTVPTSGTATVTVSTSDDDADETDGSVSVTVDSGDGYTVSTTQNSATVAVSDDDDPPPATPEISVTAGSGVTEGGDASFTVTADPAPAAPLQVSVSVSQSGDFGATTGTQTVTVGTGGTATVTVSTSDDDADEPDGSVSVTVANGSGYTVSTTQNSATVAVSDDDDPPPATPEISVTAGSGVTEGGDASFTVTADPAPTQPLQVSVSVSQSGDWGATTGTRSVTVPTSGTATVTVSTSDDDADEPDGSVSVTVANGSGYTVSTTQSSATVAVADDDDPPVQDLPEVSVSDASVVEGELGGFSLLEFRLTLTRPSDQNITVQYRVHLGTTSPSDHHGGYGRATIWAGRTHGVIAIMVVDDKQREGDEAFEIELTGADGAAIATSAATAVGTIIDND